MEYTYKADETVSLGQLLLVTGAFPSKTQLDKAVKQAQVQLRKPINGAIKNVKVTHQELDAPIEDLDCLNALNGFVVKTAKTEGLVVTAHHQNPQGYVIKYERGW